MARLPKWLWLLLAALVSAVVLPRVWLVGASTARGRAPAVIESAVANFLLHRSVSSSALAARNPLPDDKSERIAGQRLYVEHCEICHAHDGSGHTRIGSSQYPPAPALTAAVARLSDGEIFYHVRNGIRNTGMPGFALPDRHVWQLVTYLRHLPKVAAPEVAQTETRIDSAHSEPPDLAADASRLPYVGSAACERCHSEIYARWKHTRMANVVRDPRSTNNVIIPDLDKPDPLLTFTLDDVALVYGSRWKQRYFKRSGDDFYPLPVQWDVQHRQWKPYNVKVGADWWTAFYGTDNTQRPTGPLCDGCHSVNYDIATKRVVEWNVGCERCHGPSGEHVAKMGHGGTFNPAAADLVEANDVCIQCHSQGRTLVAPIRDVYYDWPVGFHVGRNRLNDYWRLEEHKVGATTFTHFADGSAHKNRMQGNDFIESQMYKHGVTCFTCHDVHGTDQPADLWQPAQSLCLGCHSPGSPNGPRAPSLEAHSHHGSGPGSQCIDCHMPLIAETIGNVMVRSHTFRFITPTQSEVLGVPNACVLCHKDKTNAWAASALTRWQSVSPWRMAED